MNNLRNFLGNKIFENKYIHIDIWSILHLIFFFIIGLYYPNRWTEVIIAMVIFEFIEIKLSKRTSFFKESFKDIMSDFAFNILGYWLAHNYGGLI